MDFDNYATHGSLLSLQDDQVQAKRQCTHSGTRTSGSGMEVEEPSSSVQVLSISDNFSRRNLLKRTVGDKSN